MMTDIASTDFNWATFHLLRPEWLFALILLFLIAALLLRRKLFSRNWQSVIDPKLMPHVLIGKPGKQSYWPIALLLIAGSLAIFAEAGPVWKRLPQPVYKQQSALVIALDLSRSMDAEDVKPSRLQRAQFKLRDLLALRKEGQTALIAYANNAFTVTPLTDDSNTIATMIPALSTSLLPAQGNNTEAALNKAVELMKNAGFNNGDILLITDDISTSTDIFAGIHRQGFKVSLLGVGTEDGAPIALQTGGFVKDADGGIVVSKLNTTQLAEAARLGGGRFITLTTDERDIKYLLGAADINRLHADSKKTDIQTDTWQEQGPWLLLLVIPLAALAFRKGYLALLIFFILPLPQPAQAMSWDELWKNDNQRAAEKFFQADPQTAAELFKNPQWRAAANYRADNFDQAAQSLQGINTSDAHYNRGNALAKLGNIDAAIKAYDEALKINPQNEDALYNKQLLQKQKNQDQSGQQGDSSDKNQSGDQQQDNNGPQQLGQDQTGNDKTGDKKSGQNESSEQQQMNPTESDKEKGEQPDKSSKHPSPQPSATAPGAALPPASMQSSPARGEGDKNAATDSVTADDLTQQATEQWLRKIPDDPGGLLRRKFKYQYQQQSKDTQGNNSW